MSTLKFVGRSLVHTYAIYGRKSSFLYDIPPTQVVYQISSRYLQRL